MAPDPQVEALRERMAGDLREAMKARDTASVSTLRSILGTFDNASAVQQTQAHKPVFGRSGDVPRRYLTLHETLVLLREEIDSRRKAALEYEIHARFENAERLREEARIIERYLTPF